MAHFQTVSMSLQRFVDPLCDLGDGKRLLLRPNRRIISCLESRFIVVFSEMRRQVGTSIHAPDPSVLLLLFSLLNLKLFLRKEAPLCCSTMFSPYYLFILYYYRPPSFISECGYSQVRLPSPPPAPHNHVSLQLSIYSACVLLYE